MAFCNVVELIFEIKLIFINYLMTYIYANITTTIYNVSV